MTSSVPAKFEKWLPLIEQLEAAKNDTAAEELAVARFVEAGDAAISALVKYAESKVISHWIRPATLNVLNQTGKPLTHEAIQFALGIAMDANAPGWPEAQEMLTSAGDAALPEIRETLRWYYDVERNQILGLGELYVLLEMMPLDVLVPLLPELLHLFSIGVPDYGVDHLALLPLGKIGSPDADAALPIIERKLKQDTRSRIHHQCLEALPHFSSESVRPLLPSIKPYLSHEDPKIAALAADLVTRLT